MVLVSGGDPAFTQRVVANAVFSDTALVGGQQSDNVWDVYGNAATYMNAPFAGVGAGLDLYPRTGMLRGSASATTGLTGYLDWNVDFNTSAYDLTYRGAYAGDGANPGWPLALALEPEPTPTATPRSRATPTSTSRPTATPTATGTPTATPTARPTPTGSSFFTLAPCRVMDTRNAPGTYGAPALAGGADRTIPLAARCGIPGTARAVSVNVTVTQASTAGDLRIYPGGAPLPNASVINYAAGQTRANNAFVAVSPQVEMAVRCDQPAGASVHFILDVNGYFE
jgi:hypothetical protein